MQNIIDYTTEFSSHMNSSFATGIIAQGKGSDFLALFKLTTPTVRIDGKRASYELIYRWLSCECTDSRDTSWACVKGDESTFWQYKEIEKLLLSIKQGKDVNLFEHFNISG